MKLLQSIIFVICGSLVGCSSIKQSSDERKVSAKKVGDIYKFKTWPTSPTTRSLELDGVTKTSAHLGPDFTVHYFNFEEGAAVSLYNGGHPRWDEELKAEMIHRAPFGNKKTDWRIIKRENDFRAETLVSEAEFSIWHVVVIAPTRTRVESLIEKMSTFR